MKRLLSLFAALMACQCASAQITITSSDMPVSGDMLSYSISSPAGSTISPADSGAGFNWNYPLSPVTQAVDTYKTALSVSFLYAATISPSAYGYKVADSLPGLGAVLPISIQQIYTFFQNSSAAFQATAFAASISGFPTPANYAIPDTWYFFPLAYANYDSSAYALSFSIPTLGGIKRVGNRKTRVDGWGTITTPYYTTPVNCIRVRSQINEVDSVTFGTTTFGLPVNTVEYKWLVNGDHYPALWVTSNVLAGTETISSIRYKDNIRPSLGIASESQVVTTIRAYPVPAVNTVSLDVPADWNDVQVTIFDAGSKVVGVYNKSSGLNIRALPAGTYIAHITSGSKTGYAQIVK